jgi:hypothetical protein
VKQSGFLLMFQDISEVFVKRNIVPICMHCKMIRDEQDNWRSVEGLFDKGAEIDYSHGICPNCLKIHHPKFAQKIRD